MNDPQPEPSMEEILASIRRIISEEDQPAVESAAPAPAQASDDDLMVFDDDEPEPEMAPLAAPEPAPAAAAPKPVPEPVMIEAPSTPDAIVSEPAVSAAAGAFNRLAGSLRVSDLPGQTLEALVRDLLKPMMKQWLDANLPAIVEAKVEAELDRIARLAR